MYKSKASSDETKSISTHVRMISNCSEMYTTLEVTYSTNVKLLCKSIAHILKALNK